MEKINITKIKLYYKDIPGAGKQIHAYLGQEIPCVEFTMKGDVPQPITYVSPPEHAPEILLYSEMWVQFAPIEWNQMVEDVFKEMVKLWNEKHGKEIE